MDGRNPVQVRSIQRATGGWPGRRWLSGTATVLAVAGAVLACGSGDANVSPPSSTSTTSSSRTGAGSPARSTSGGVDALAGFRLPVPDGWAEQQKAVVGTEFQSTASTCVAVEVVDSPAGESGGPSIAHAVVQICAVRRADGMSLREWLAARHATNLTAATFGTCHAQEVPGGAERRLAYVQTSDRRAEIAIVVVTTPEKSKQRQAEVTRLLNHLQCPTG